MRTMWGVMAATWVLLAGAPAQAAELQCNSLGYRYQYCQADTRNKVELKRQVSSAACVFGRSWGYDQRGVWVNNGCAGVFSYGGGGGSGDRGEKVAAGIVAAAILGAMISASNDHHQHQDSGGISGGGDYGVAVPAWAVGHFAGPDREGGPPIEIAVDPNGRINGMQGSNIFQGQMRGTDAWIGNRSYGVVRAPDGIRLVGAGHGGYDLHRQ